MWERTKIIRSQYQVIELFFDPETNHLRLDINGNTQFMSTDEHRYHELMVFAPYILASKKPKRVLILGGGDGLAVREALKFAEHITVVDIDRDMTELAKTDPFLVSLNQNSLNNEKVKVVNKDGFRWATYEHRKKWDMVICDYPDPASPTLARLFSKSHYEAIKTNCLNEDGILCVQSGGALMLPFMGYVGMKLSELFKECLPLKVELVNGIQGFWIASDKTAFDFDRVNGIETKAFDKAMLRSAMSWSKDLLEQLYRADKSWTPYEAYIYSLAWIEYMTGRRAL